MQFYTTTLTDNSLVIESADGAYQISVQAETGATVTVTGSIPFKGNNPSAITLSAGQAITITSNNSTALDGLIISATGSASIIIGLN